MKKIILLSALALTAASVNGQIIRKGDMVVDLGIGVGTAQVAYSEYQTINGQEQIVGDKAHKATFTQRLGFEVGVFDLSDESSIGFGVSLNNSCGAFHNSIINGSYNYSYPIYDYIKENNRWKPNGVLEGNRNGTGSAQARTTIEDFNVMFRVAYHREFIDNLDAYCAVGFGVSTFRDIYSDYSHKQGINSVNKTFDPDYNGMTQLCYTYDDNDHIQWQNSSASGRFVIAAYIGARYFLTENWGINAQLGLTSLSFKKDANNYSIFDIGASYRF